MAKSGAACHVARHGGNVDVTQAVLLVANVTLFFEHAELGADGGVAELIGEFRQVCLPKTRSALKTQRFRSFVRSWWLPLWSKKSCVGLKSRVTVMVSGFQACS